MPRRKWLAATVLAAVALVCTTQVRSTVLATKLLLGVQRMAAGGTADSAAAVESRIYRRNGERELTALLYAPARQSAFCSILLVPGISEQGCYHPRLKALSRTLADIGFVVVTPDIVPFREFQISPASLEEIAFWYRQLKTVPGAGSARHTGLAGISFSATLALIAAARPDLRDSVDLVFGIGAYDDPLRCSTAWFAAGAPMGAADYYPTRFYAKWIIMMAALDMVEQPSERRFLADVLRALLLQKPVSAAPVDLSPEGVRWYRLAVARETDALDSQLTRALQDHLTPVLYAKITPDRAAAEIRCPVFLVHGAHDDLIPAEESIRLQKRIGKDKAFLLISPFLTHTHPLDKELSWREKTWAALDTFLFFHRLARTVR